jgi:VIT1/CCC1 family predicted Fe2+/Mn2+ transporter
MFAQLMSVLRSGVRAAFVGGVEDSMPEAKTMATALTVETAHGMRAAVRQAVLDGIGDAMIEASGVVVPSIAVEPMQPKRIGRSKAKAA